MPRDGSGNYTQPFPNVVDGTTIESAVYNGFTNDVALQLNGPIPVSAGGTGADGADAALINLGGEKAKQVVTNYDSHAFVTGSFYSASGATGAPEAISGFSGICHVYDTGNFMTLEARSYGPGISWTRQKSGGTWGAWTQGAASQADADARYVNIAGDTMTGHLSLPVTPAAANAVRKDYVDAADTTITTSMAGKVTKSGDSMNGTLTQNRFGENAQLVLNTNSGFGCDVAGQKSGNSRWFLRLGNEEVESGSNTGSNFQIVRFNDNGSIASSPFSINRANSATYISNGADAGISLVVGGAVGVPRIQLTGDAGAGLGGVIYFNTGNGGSINSLGTVRINGVAQMFAEGGMTVGEPAGEDKGAGTINAQAVYDDSIAPPDVAMLAELLKAKALSAMPTPEAWSQNDMSVGELINRLWLSNELLISAFSAAVARVEALEAKTP